jgi:hypothetical protein
MTCKKVFKGSSHRKFCSRLCYFEAYHKGLIKNRRWFGFPEGNPGHHGKTSGSFKHGHPALIGPNTKLFQKGQNQWYLERGLPAPSKGKQWTKTLHTEAVLEEVKRLREQGFLAVPVDNPQPDIVAFKDGKVYAVEVELPSGRYHPNPDYTKYERIPNLYDDIIWIIRH